MDERKKIKKLMYRMVDGQSMEEKRNTEECSDVYIEEVISLACAKRHLFSLFAKLGC